jgi:hypothetical protein
VGDGLDWTGILLGGTAAHGLEASWSCHVDGSSSQKAAGCYTGCGWTGLVAVGSQGQKA